MHHSYRLNGKMWRRCNWCKGNKTPACPNCKGKGVAECRCYECLERLEAKPVNHEEAVMHKPLPKDVYQKDGWDL